MRDANKRRKLESTSSQLYWPRDETGWQTNSSRAPSKATAPPPASRPAMTAPLARAHNNMQCWEAAACCVYVSLTVCAANWGGGLVGCGGALKVL